MSALDTSNLSDKGGWLRRLRLSQRIAIGFGIVLALHLSTAVVSHVGLDHDQERVTELNSGRRLTLQMMEIDQQVGALQSQVLAYTFNGSVGQQQRILDASDRLRREVEHAKTQVSGTRLGALNQMSERLSHYRQQFQLAVQDREKRRHLVEQRLPEVGLRAATLVGDMVEEAALNNDSERAKQLGRLQNELLRTEVGLRSYLSRLDSAAMRQARESVQRAVAVALELTGADASSAPPHELVAEILPSYRQVLTQLVQATRGFLHLTNVVMAGDAQDFLRLSATLRHEQRAELDALAIRIGDEQRRFQLLAAGFSALTILLGLAAGHLIGRSIVKPVSSITQTMSTLAKGDQTSEIPGQTRQDEIGSLARAAQVFQDKNIETSSLLKETRRLAAQHQTVIEHLEESNRELDQFAHAASHDLKAPLRSINTVSEWLEEDLAKLIPAKSLSDLQLMRQRVRRMNSLLDDLLQYSRAGRREFAIENVRLGQLMDDVILLMQPPSDFTIARDGFDGELKMARLPLELVLGNLLGNAVKHHDRPTGRIHIHTDVSDSELLLRISDDGPGIPERFHEAIFEPFRTLRPRDEVEGSGMGLALVRKLVDRYRGAITISSDPDKRGTTFLVRWPISLTGNTTTRPHDGSLEATRG